MTAPAPLTDDELAEIKRNLRHEIDMDPDTASRLIAEVERLGEQNDGLYQATLMLGAEVERMADTLWAICDGDGSPQDRIIAAGGLGDRYDHSKPHGR